jgi:hypothetical protein
MPLGVTVRTRTAPPSRGAPTDTGTAFVAGKSTGGPLDAVTEIRSIADFAGVYGDRAVGNVPLYDWLDVFFREGGTRALGNPNRAAAGRDFPLQYATGFETTISDTDRESLLDSHAVNTFAEMFGVLELYGFQTGRDEDPDDPFWQANCGRARMWLKARAFAAAQPYVFRTIDGRGRLAAALKGDLDAICLALYGVDGLFGETPQDAFATEVGASVNTTDTIAQGELNAAVEARLSLHAKAVNIDLVSVPVTGTVSG